ncbi:ATP-binding protein [Microtetraspora niveoalba]|uniref:ATP-binding protein n=1 Tax=Microtetraspora niveoalba TaxID=46175 RepID=UPI000836F539|nr:ATP-binding protein [Microtetraspora niveoalba]
MTADLAGRRAGAAPSWATPAFGPDSPGPAAAPLATCALHGDTASASAARDFTAHTLGGWGLAGLIDDAQLVVSELVTNALRHALAAGPEAPIQLRLLSQGLHVLCAVRDPSEAAPLPGPPGDDFAETGRGLHLVEAVSLTWGWILIRGSGKIVWALLDHPA